MNRWLTPGSAGVLALAGLAALGAVARRNLIIVTVVGDSMSPTLNDGSRLLAYRSQGGAVGDLIIFVGDTLALGAAFHKRGRGARPRSAIAWWQDGCCGVARRLAWASCWRFAGARADTDHTAAAASARGDARWATTREGALPCAESCRCCPGGAGVPLAVGRFGGDATGGAGRDGRRDVGSAVRGDR